jgi:hypothetical protein
MNNDCSFADFFNKRLKGKYAYWVKMRYIFPLDSLDYKTYIKYEQMSDIQFMGHGIWPHIDLYCEECCMMGFAQEFINAGDTEAANSIHDFIVSNKYVVDYDINMNDLKSFRTWLANELLSLNTYTTDQQHMLEYYKNNMYNDVVKYLDRFGNSAPIFVDSLKSSCTCCNASIKSDNSAINTCDALSNYKSNIRSFMIDTFSNVEFWKACNKSFMMLFKKYIDNIITANLTLPNDDKTIININSYAGCNCVNSNNHELFVRSLENLSTAIQYIIDDNINGHKNFIYDAFNNWSSNMYEKMIWK